MSRLNEEEEEYQQKTKRLLEEKDDLEMMQKKLEGCQEQNGQLQTRLLGEIRQLSDKGQGDFFYRGIWEYQEKMEGCAYRIESLLSETHQETKKRRQQIERDMEDMEREYQIHSEKYADKEAL
ncbi:MAG: hypothetical protein PHX08_13930 [Lachnospiraceae bacterium]|nr:hypothetical protein [Lachnospiraceae bacterium]